MWVRNSQIFDVHTGTFSPSDIQVEKHWVVEIGKAPKSTEEGIDLEDGHVLPRFIDCHVHICVNTRSGTPREPYWRQHVGTGNDGE